MRNGRMKRTDPPWIEELTWADPVFWRRTFRTGSEYRTTNDGFRVFVDQRGSKWRAKVEHLATGYTRSSKLPYSTSDEAKDAAYKVIAQRRASGPG